MSWSVITRGKSAFHPAPLIKVVKYGAICHEPDMELVISPWSRMCSCTSWAKRNSRPESRYRRLERNMHQAGPHKRTISLRLPAQLVPMRMHAELTSLVDRGQIFRLEPLHAKGVEHRFGTLRDVSGAESSVPLQAYPMVYSSPCQSDDYRSRWHRRAVLDSLADGSETRLVLVE